MTEPTAATFVGAKYSASIAGFFGSVVALTFLKELTVLQMLLAVFTGCATSTYTTPLFMHYLSVSSELNDGVAFVIGVVAMNLVPAVLALVDSVRKNAGEIIKKRI